MRVALVAPQGRYEPETVWPGVFAGGVVFARLLMALPEGYGYVCPFHLFTGLPCPGCGGTRAVAALSGLDFAGAFRWNPMVASGALVALAFTLYAGTALVLRTRRVRIVSISLVERVVLGAVALANWMYLIADGR